MHTTRLQQVLALLASSLILATAPTAAAQPAPTSSSAPAPQAGFQYGTILNALEDARLAREAGFTLMSAYVAWQTVEPERGHFVFERRDQWGQTAPNDLTNVLDAARGNKLKVGLRLDDPPSWAGDTVARLDPADVEEYVYHVVKYAAGTIAYIEVFNELNLPLEWGTTPVDPGAYARLLAGAYRGARRADPAVLVVSAAPSQRTGGLGGTMEDVDWLSGLYAAGGGAFFDALGMHAYLGSYAANADPICSPMCFRTIELYRAVMEQYGDSGKKALITEFGVLEQAPVDLGPYEWMEVPAAQRGEALVGAFRMAATAYPWLLGATTFNLDYAANQPRTGERFWFSLLNADRTPRAALTSFTTARASGVLP